uniref:Putative ovule protein n=1 Tax=Solanum chacoense TaxID=4108 RepID=A0A0V0GWL3_SOLCH
MYDQMDPFYLILPNSHTTIFLVTNVNITINNQTNTPPKEHSTPQLPSRKGVGELSLQYIS